MVLLGDSSVPAAFDSSFQQLHSQISRVLQMLPKNWEMEMLWPWLVRKGTRSHQDFSSQNQLQEEQDFLSLFNDSEPAGHSPSLLPEKWVPRGNTQLFQAQMFSPGKIPSFLKKFNGLY